MATDSPLSRETLERIRRLEAEVTRLRNECDSGDPLDLTLTEIGQALNWIEEHAHTSNAPLERRREKEKEIENGNS